MSRLVTRTWLAEGGYDGAGWGAGRVREFAAAMAAASAKPRRRPPLVTAWDDGRGCAPWYEAHAGKAERRLRAHIRTIFGTRERAAGGGAPAIRHEQALRARREAKRRST